MLQEKESDPWLQLESLSYVASYHFFCALLSCESCLVLRTSAEEDNERCLEEVKDDDDDDVDNVYKVINKMRIYA
ncbi:hypothetical protein HID58_017800 [Brassica napus]|uniref:Uncharacterized protein n=1 Tax=Brassica napus TaxID=3708 RepID=A0ABQ8D845_BRANA|nr:hypothetical protein HID58_017800 [Brassica napus]